MSTPKIEHRTISTRTINATLRAATATDNKLKIGGMAAAYGVLSGDVGGFREKLKRGCFARALRTNPDVKCLLNHNADVVLGRCANGTLTLRDSDEGLMFDCELNPDSRQHRDIHASIKRGDLSECSFAFNVNGPDGDEWTDNVTDENGKRFVQRTVKDANLFDVSAVTFPAYNAKGSTSVQARSTNYTVTRAGVVPTFDVGAEIDKFNRTRLAEQAREIAKQA